MTFHQSKHQLLFDYHINVVKLQTLDEVIYLGVVPDPKLTFNGHYTSLISKANQQLDLFIYFGITSKTLEYDLSLILL